MKRIKKLLTKPDRHSKVKPVRRRLGRAAVVGALSIGTLLGTLATPASAGTIHRWDWRWNHPQCWPDEVSRYYDGGQYVVCGGWWTVAGNIFETPTHPTAQNIRNECEGGWGRCTYTIKSKEEYWGPTYKVSPDHLWNCTNNLSQLALPWSQTTSTSHTLTGGITFGPKIKDIFDLQFNFQYGYSWSNSNTTGQISTLSVSPGYVGWWARRQLMRRVTGEYVTHFTEPHWGHYVWYLPHTAVGPASTSGQGDLFAQQRPMTAQERAEHCPYYGLFRG